MCGVCVSGADANHLTDEEQRMGFVLLFNGRNFEGWRQAGNWKVENGAMVCVKPGDNLVCKKVTFADAFELRFQWKVRGKSRLPGPLDGTLSVSDNRPEPVDDQSDGNKWEKVTYYYATGGGYIGFATEVVPFGKSPPAIEPLSFIASPNKIASRRIGKWNEAKIIWKGAVFQHWLNGEKILDMAIGPRIGNIPKLLAVAAKCRKKGLHLEIEDWESPLCYRGIKFCPIVKVEKEGKMGGKVRLPCSVSTSRSSNRTGGFPASGSRTRVMTSPTSDDGKTAPGSAARTRVADGCQGIG
jgi:hypothetical protein